MAATKLAMKGGVLVGTEKGLLAVDDDGPCCLCETACLTAITPNTVSITLSDVFKTAGADPGAGFACAECEDFNDEYELPRDTFIGGALNYCAWRDSFITDCTLEGLEGFECKAELLLIVSIDSCINGDGKCEAFIRAQASITFRANLCGTSPGPITGSATINFGEAGAGCGNFCISIAGGAGKRLEISDNGCLFLDIRGESITIPACAYVYSGGTQPICWADDAGAEVTIQF